MKAKFTAIAFIVTLLGAAFAAAPSYAQGTEAYGYAAKRPVIGGACVYCPWGALADVVKEAMSHYGYNVAVCYNCARVDGPRQVAAREIPKPLDESDNFHHSPQPPNAPLDFGVSGGQRVYWAYKGKYDYVKDPRPNLRVIARIDQPSYTIIAVTKKSGITDLAEIKAKKMPVKIMASGGFQIDPILKHYGITEEEVKTWGGSYDNAMARQKSEDFDVIISSIGTLSNFPEGNVWYEMSQKHDLVYLQLPDDLLKKIADEFQSDIVDMPKQYLRGQDKNIRSIANSGQLVYGRDDMPEQFAYDVAKALDEHKHLLRWKVLPFSYDNRTVWKNFDMPLHPGAARYYREVGYMK